MAFDAIEWLNNHPEIWEEYQGQWVALTVDGIVAHAPTADEAARQMDVVIGETAFFFKVSVRDGRPHFYQADQMEAIVNQCF